MSNVVQDHRRCSICGELTNWVVGLKHAEFSDGNCICIDCVTYLSHPERLKVLQDFAAANGGEARVQVGPELFRFSSFSNWVNKAKGWFRGVPAGSWVCIDQRGRICNSGKEFMRADREGAFPIVVYSIDPEAIDE
jgi:hypothetical protein